MKQIKVSEQVYDKLEERRDNGGHTSFDSAVRELIYDAKND